MIRLFKCYQCWYIFDEAVLYAGKHVRCLCGSEHFKAANPSIFNIMLYVFFQKMHAIKRILGR